MYSLDGKLKVWVGYKSEEPDKTFSLSELDCPQLVNEERVYKPVHMELVELSEEIEKVEIEFYGNLPQGDIPQLSDGGIFLYDGDTYKVGLIGEAYLGKGKVVKKDE